MIKDQYAIIDMGSNSFRLVINEVDHHGQYNELHNYKTVARLSTYILNNGYLSDEGVAIVSNTLTRFKEIIDYHQIPKLIVIATAAMRKAKNKEEIVRSIEKKLGMTIRILSEYEEAFYGYLAIVNSTNISDGFTVDIGGGSTEITLFKNRTLVHYHSFPFGAITLHQKFFQQTKNLADAVQALKNYIREQWLTLPWLATHLHYPVIGIGGSARNLSLIHQRQVNYPLAGIHQYEIPKTEVFHINDMLQLTSSEERSQIDGLSKDRVEIIVPAVEIISSIVDHVQAEKFIMSRKGLRDGVFYEELLKTMETNRFPNVIEENMYQITSKYNIKLDYVSHISYLAMQLYKQLSPFALVDHDQKEALKLLQLSARVLYIGETINSESSSQNTFYLLTNITIEGLSHQERLAVAFISSYKSKSQMMKYAEPFIKIISKSNLKLFEFLGSIMKLAYSLDRTKRKIITKIGQVTENNDQLVLPLYYKEDPYFENIQAKKNKKQLEKSIKQSIEFLYKPLK
ncbi:exopolyphosphatase [Halalkalibacter alkalisediminis]|uniref:Exopolyphosphatase n=1 Tax=Halalkalibacter alkalisediminis TaxID=935616 RepID=A0ABV6NBB4_9BACI|nr:exopolyphosphatase [Halalkalibacter alkalisediminis]